MVVTEHPERSKARSATAGPRTPLLDIVLLLAEEKGRLALVTLAALLLGSCMSLLIRPSFTAKATILPPQAPQSSLSTLMGQLGSISGLGGGAGSLLKNPADTYVGILQSRTIADHAIDKFHLLALWHLQRREDARRAVAQHVQIEMAKNGLIEITAVDKDPRQASDFANFFVDELYGMNSYLAISEASQRRLFFDQQLAEERAALASAEEDLKNTQLKTGVITLGGQTELAIRSIAQSRAAIASKEVQLQGLRTYAAGGNPDVLEAEQELSALRAQLAQLENSQKRLSPGDTGIAASQVPSTGLEYARKLREVKYHDTLFELLSRQAEAARIDEAKSAPIIQVIDRAVPPDKKSGPPRLLIVVSMGVLGFCAGCLWIFIRGALARARQTSALALKLDRLRLHFKWR